MKKQINSIKRTRVFTLALCASLLGIGAAYGQGPGPDQGGGPGGPDGPGGPGESGTSQGNRPPPPPPPPIIQALDTNHDGILEADEIANATASLQTLLKSGSTELTMPQLLGPPRHGPHPRGRGPMQPQAQTSGSSDASGSPPPGPPPGGPRGHHHPAMALIQALDTNHDGILEAGEIASAPQSLKTLENSSGEIDLRAMRPPPPPDGMGPPPSESGTNAQGDNPPPPPPDGMGPPPSESGTNGQGENPPPPPPQ